MRVHMQPLPEGLAAVVLGSHSPRLAALKRQYDPECLFTVHRGVDGDDWGPGPG
jgi:hypothetical protein